MPGSEGGREEKDQPKLAPRRSADPTSPSSHRFLGGRSRGPRSWPPTRCTPSASMRSSWSRRRTRTTSWWPRKTSPACMPRSRTCPGGTSLPVTPSATAAMAGRSAARCRSPPSLPGSPSARRAGHPSHPPDPAAVRREVAHRHRLRDHQPGRPPGHTSPPRGMDPRSLAHRGPAPHPRRQLRRGRLPDPHRQRAPGHGRPAQPDDSNPQALQRPQHRRRLPPPRPGRHPRPGHSRIQPAMTETDIKPLCRGPGCLAMSACWSFRFGSFGPPASPAFGATRSMTPAGAGGRQ